MSSRVYYPNAAIGEADAGWIEADGKMADHYIAVRIDHAYGVDSGFRDKQPFRDRIIGHAGWQKAAQWQEPRNANDDLTEHFVIGNRDHGDGIGVGVGDVELVTNWQNSSGRAAAGANPLVDYGLLRVVNIDDGDRIRFLRIRITQRARERFMRKNPDGGNGSALGKT